MRVGLIGLGNLGGKLGGTILRGGWPLAVHDLDRGAAEGLEAAGAEWAETPEALAAASDIVVTCLPSPAASAAVMEGPGGLLGALGPGKTWLEMSTTDAEEVRRLGALVAAQGAAALDCPVSGGCHRAASGNISVLAGGAREDFERALPLLTTIGRRILHTGPLGSASVLKVVTNYLATANLVTVCEALATAAGAGLDLATAYHAIAISSGTSFVHETEGQVILNGSREINFTMDLVMKDISLFQAVADRAGVPLEISPRLIEIFADGIARYGPRERSPAIVQRLEEATGLDIRAPGFPAEMVDDEPPCPGAEIRPARK